MTHNDTILRRGRVHETPAPRGMREDSDAPVQAEPLAAIAWARRDA